MININNKWKISEEDALIEYQLIQKGESNLTARQRQGIVNYVETKLKTK